MMSSPITSLPSSFMSGQGNSPGRMGSLTAYAISASLALISASRVVRSRSTRSDAAFSEPRSTRIAASASTEITKISANPRCGLSLRSARTTGLPRAAADLDFAVSDHVTHFTGAAVEHFSRLQSDARPAVTGRHAYSPFAAAAWIAQRLGRTVLERFAVYPDGGATLGAHHIAVETRGGGGRDRGGGGLVRHARLAPGVERGALLRREEQTAEFLRAAGARRCIEPQAEQEDERWLHRLAARSMMVIRSISQPARSRGTMDAPVAAWPVRVITHCFTE